MPRPDACIAARDSVLTQVSLTISSRSSRWVDQTFLWGASSLAVMTIAAILSHGARWPAEPAHAPARRAAPAPAAAPAAPAAPRPAPPAIAFAEPVPGYPVISPFGLRQLPWEEAGRLHKGVDIAAPLGSPVLAAADGVVTRTGVDGGYGRFVELAHAGGLHSLYGHLSRFEAKAGAVVRQGEAIGLMGSTGSSTGAHVHFEIHDPEGRALNPQMLLGRSFPRLADLPLRAAARLPGRSVRLAFVSYIPPAKAALMLAREKARTAAEAATLPAATPRLAVIPVQPVRLAASAQAGVQILGPGADGRVHAVISAGG